ncbi:MAG: hypothetical protein ACRDJ0_08465 [Actinomycetota bacterium]
MSVVPIALYLVGVRGITDGQMIGGLPASLWYLASSAFSGPLGLPSPARVLAWPRNRHPDGVGNFGLLPLTESGWLAGRLLSSLLITIPVVIVVAVLSMIVGDVQLGVTRWVGLLVAVAVGCVPIALIGLIIGLAFRYEAASARVSAFRGHGRTDVR